MNDTHIHRHLTTFILAAAEHQRLDREHRTNWRYRHKQEEIRPHRAQALITTERAYNQLHRALSETTEPTYLTRLARQLLQYWDNYRRNHAIMLAEYNRHNQQHTADSRNLFETQLKDTAEKLKAIQNKS